MSQPTARRSVYSTRTKLAVVVVLVLAAAGFALAVATTSEPDDGDVAVTGSSDDQAGFGPERVIVERVLPGRGVESVTQQPVGLDLAAGWTVLSFELNGVAVPVEQLEVVDELARYTFVPGDDRAVSEYRPGTNCASAVVTRLGEGVEADTRTERWCFEVL